MRFTILVLRLLYLLALSGSVNATDQHSEHQLVTRFGTVNGIGQSTEHELITRAALACDPPLSSSNGDCFEPLSIAQVAGQQRTAGAVGAPDADESTSAVAHCDDADYLDFAKYKLPGTYPRTRSEATQNLIDCIAHLSGRIDEGLTGAERLLDDKDNIIKSESDIERNNCVFFLGVSGRAKCDAIEGLGRALHGVQDFYSHSNWADNADASEQISIQNPPGLHLGAASPLFDLKSAMSPVGFTVPPDLSTGCFILGFPPDLSGARDCIKQGRITHETLNKDKGDITAKPGVSIPPTNPITRAPKTPRGQITSGTNNFELAVQGAIAETRRQWADFRAGLVERYGPKRAGLMVCAMTKDYPWQDCSGRKIALVIDSSGSNQETDPSFLRVDAAKQFANTLVTADSAGLDNRPDLVSVITFTTDASVIYPLGDPATAVFDGIGADGGTYIAGGVSLAIEELTKDTTISTQDHAGILVFTDGQDSDTSALLSQLDRAAQLGIRVSFGFLSPPASPVQRRMKARSVRTRNSEPAFYPRQVSGASEPSESPTELITAILKTGGFFGTINSAEAQASFVDGVIARGSTNINGISSSLGGPLFPGVTVYGLTPAIGEPQAIFTYHAAAGENLSIETHAITGPPLNVTLHNVNVSADSAILRTDTQGLAKIVYAAKENVSLELAVANSGIASGNLTSGLFSVDLKVPGLPVNGTCKIPAGSACTKVGERKCCGTGFITCDFSGYMFRECAPETACKPDNGSGGFSCAHM